MKSELQPGVGGILRMSRVMAGIALVGGIAVAIGATSNLRQLGFSYLLAFMLFLSVILGGLFFVLVHHLFDSHWSVCMRRVAEQLAFLALPMAALFIPLALLAPQMYAWMHPTTAGEGLRAKSAYLNPTFFYVRAALCFAIWIFLSWRLRHWSLEQDKTGEARFTYRMRRLSAAGIYLFAFTLTIAAIDWIKSLQFQWFSTMFGVYYFAGCAWLGMATLYGLAVWLRKTGPLRGLVNESQLHDLGVLMLVFTVFYAYIHFAQYFIIWNANLPEETFWYVTREKGWWWAAGMVLVFGHFLLPFLLLLRIDAKLKPWLMIPLCGWFWLMHFVDISFNVLPPLHLEEFPWHWTDAACCAMIGGALGFVFLRNLARHPIYPIRDPRLKESLTIHEVPPPAIAESVHSYKE
jgi:hypothetical protein